jgi:hypothetical protein
MKINKIVLRKNGPFTSLLADWSQDKSYEVTEFEEDLETAHEGIDGLVIFNANQEIDKEISDIRIAFDKRQKPVHNIDINGTLMVGVSNLDLWIERNRCKSILIVGSDLLVGNPNLERYLSNIH